MKHIKNKHMGGCGLRVSDRQYQGNAEGIFTMEDEHADRLLATPGWEPAEAPVPEAPENPAAALRAALKEPAAPPAPTAPEPAPSASESPAAPEAPQEPKAPAEEPQAAPSAPEEPAESGEEEEEGPDLAPMTKNELLETAKTWNVELTSTQKKLPVDELRAVIDKAIYGVQE